MPKSVFSAVHLAVIRLQNSTPEQHRTVFDFLRDAGIGVQLHYTPVHLQPYYRSLSFKPGQFPESEFYSTNSLSLPLFLGLSQEDQENVLNQLTKALHYAKIAF